jgi:hypothetical protein
MLTRHVQQEGAGVALRFRAGAMALRIKAWRI